MTGEYVLITGAYGGLGKALSVKYAENGYGLILLGRKEDSLINLKNELSSTTDIMTIICDVSDWESCKNAYNEVKSHGIKLNTLINNAGITYIQNLNKDYDIEKYQSLINTNLNGPIYLTRLFIEDLVEKRGSVITISSVIGYAPVIGRTAYAASKFGLEGFFSVLRAEQNGDVQVLMAYPTFIETDIRKNISGDNTANEVLTAKEVADKIYIAHSNNKSRVFIGKTAKLSYRLYKYFPNLYVNLMRKKLDNKIQVSNKKTTK